MGKLKKTPPKGQGQKSISAFFKPGVAGAPAQKSSATCKQSLFTSVGAAPQPRLGHAELGHQGKKGECSDGFTGISKTVTKVTSPSCIIQKQSSSLPQQSPAGSLRTTPNGKAVSEDDVIPDTPDAVKAAPRRIVKGRSFLSSSNFLVNPTNHAMAKPKLKVGAKQRKGRNFEDAYKEMLNREAEASGEPLEKGDLTTLMTSAGMPLPAGIKPQSIQSPPETSSSKTIQEPRGSCNDVISTSATVEGADGGARRCSSEKSSPSLLSPQSTHPQKSLPQPSPACKLQIDSRDTKKKTASGLLSGMKRSSSKGESPNAKRHARHNSASPRKPKLGNKAVCKRKILGCGKKNAEVKGGVKSQSWNIEPSFCENDSVLSDILNEMKETETTATKYLKKSPPPQSDSLTLANSSSMAAGQENTDIEVLATSMDVDVGEVLTGIIDELRNKTPKSKTPKSSQHWPGKKYTVKKTPRRLQKKEQTSPSEPHIADSVDMMEVERGLGEAEEKALSRSLHQLSPFKTHKPEPAQQFQTPVSNQPPVCATFGRHTVKEVTRSSCDTRLSVVSALEQQSRTVVLQGFWQDVHVAEGDVINITGTFDSEHTCYVTDRENLLVVSPDTLISGTTVVNTVYCMRKSVLNERFKGVDGQNVYMLYGSVIHGIFQQVMEEKVDSESRIRAIAESHVRQARYLQDMYCLSLTVEAVMAEVEKYLPQIKSFVQKHAAYAAGLARPPEKEVAILQVTDIEENIWCPKFGLKGKIDLTVNIKRHEAGRGWVKRLVPLELKTGKPSFSIEHQGQVTLYSMMSAVRREDPEGGLLLYLKDGSMKTIPSQHANQRGLVQLRNELAYYLQRCLRKPPDGGRWSGGLPEPINNARSCSKCPQLLNCCLYQRIMEGWEAPPGHAMASLADTTLAHLRSAHLNYYYRWGHLLHLEMATEGKRGISPQDIWTKTPQDRESRGQCICGLKLSAVVKTSEANEPATFTHTFRRGPGMQRLTPLNSVGPGLRDSIVVSAEDKPYICVGMGTITSISSEAVQVILDRDLRVYERPSPLVYCLDRCDTFNTMGINFTNLTRLMEDTPRGVKLRELLVEKKEPQFDLTMSKVVIEKIRPMFKHLNKPQKAAILKNAVAFAMNVLSRIVGYKLIRGTHKEITGNGLVNTVWVAIDHRIRGRMESHYKGVLMSKDYVLIKGYPGTGKTSTIVALVRILCALNFSVLLASYTHSAVDNILLKLKQHGVDFVRLGRVSRIHEDIQPFAAERLTKGMSSVAAMAEFYESKPVVATTCLGVRHPVISQRLFDVCIVDEASQVLQPACLGPLMASKRFVLVGDPLQLPPVVQSKEAREAGMAESLFARLDDTGATYELNLQYRMNHEIMALSNTLVYSGALKCGSPRVGEAKLQASGLPDTLQDSPDWLREALDVDRPVVYLDTHQAVSAQAKQDESRVTSQLEAHLVRQMIDISVKAGIAAADIGVISPYRQQVRLLHDLLSSRGHPLVEVNTVDQYQGRDKALIIMSFVQQSETNALSGGILNDMRRLNVALTRARHKMVLIGCRPVLQQYEPIAELLAILTEHQSTLLCCHLMSVGDNCHLYAVHSLPEGERTQQLRGGRKLD